MFVLIVDDEPLVAHTLSLIFRQQGFHTAIAHSADVALASARHATPDLVLCDIEMPGRDGLSLMEDLARELPACPVLVLTGAYGSLTRVRTAAEAHRYVAILTKPCQPCDLLRTASGLLGEAGW